MPLTERKASEKTSHRYIGSRNRKMSLILDVSDLECILEKIYRKELLKRGGTNSMDNVDLKVVDPANKREPWDNSQGNWL